MAAKRRTAGDFRITMADISRMAGVSVASVSKVVNGDYSRVSRETRERILRVVRETHYQPNRLARGLATKRTGILGLLVSDITNPFFAALAKGVEDRANASRYNVILCNTDDLPEREAAYADILRQTAVEGVIVTGGQRMDQGLLTERLSRWSIPFVTIERYIDEQTVGVFLDNVKGTFMATRHLLDKGHRRIAFIGGDAALATERNNRLVGYRDAMTGSDVGYDASLVRLGTYHIETGSRMIAELLDAGVGFTAVVCGNDLIAFGVVNALRERGRSVPEDVSVIGYDDIFMASLFQPHLTTIRQPIYQMGSYAVESLLSLVQERTVAQRVRVFEPELVERDSVRPPR